MRKKVPLPMAIAALAATALLAQQARRLEPDPSVAKIPVEQDVQIGRQVAQELAKQYPLVRNEQVQPLLDRMIRRLTSQPDAGKFPYNISLVADPSINAAAYPGGTMIIHTGLISSADNEDQVAGVLGHEVSHVALRHGVANMVKAQKYQMGAGIAGALAGIFLGGGIAGQLAQMGVGMTAQTMMLRNSREFERQADILGTRLMNGAGYNPIEMARFFEKLEASGGSRGPEFLQSHPNPGNRVKLVEQEIQALPRTTYNAAQPQQFRQAQQAVQGIKVPTRNADGSLPTNAPRQGSVQPRYQGRTFQIDNPAGWEIFASDQDPDSVTIAPRSGLQRGSHGGVDIGLGVMVGKAQRSGNLRQSTQSLIRSLSQQNRNMRVGGQRQLSVDGNPALLTTMTSDSAMGGEEFDYLVTVALPDRLFYGVFIAPTDDAQRWQPIFQRMIESIRFAR